MEIASAVTLEEIPTAVTLEIPTAVTLQCT